MGETKYFIFCHEAAFAGGVQSGLIWKDEGLVPEDSNTKGTFITPVLDCGSKGNLWQRLLSKLDLAAGADVRWRLFTTDMAYEAQGMEELIGDVSIPADEKLARMSRLEKLVSERSEDFLLPGVRGRFLVAACELSGDAKLRSLQIFCEWESFIDYLPEIFRDDGSFLDRFLRLFSVQYLELEQDIDALYNLLDPRVAPPDTLRWLAETIGIPNVDLWGVENLRGLLCAGVYAKKGRLSAIGELVENFCGFPPYVVENHRQLTGVVENDTLYQGAEITIFLPPEAADANLSMDALDLVIRGFVESGVSVRTHVLDNYPVLSCHAYIGINTRVGDYALPRLDVSSKLSFTILGF